MVLRTEHGDVEFKVIDPIKLLTYEELREASRNWNEPCPNHGIRIFDCAFTKHPKKNI